MEGFIYYKFINVFFNLLPLFSIFLSIVVKLLRFCWASVSILWELKVSSSFFLCYCSQYLWGKSIGQCSCYCFTRCDQRGETCWEVSYQMHCKILYCQYILIIVQTWIEVLTRIGVSIYVIKLFWLSYQHWMHFLRCWLESIKNIEVALPSFGKCFIDLVQLFSLLEK